MKTLNFLSYEKLNINPISFNDFGNSIIKNRIDPKNIKFEDLKFGWLFKTKQPKNNIYILLDKLHYGKIIGFDKTYSEKNLYDTLLTFTDDERFETIVFNYYGNHINKDNWWVYMKYNTTFVYLYNICEVYETSINLDMFDSYTDIINFYKKYNLNSL